MDILKYFKALSDETRLRLVNILVHHELKVGEIVSVLEMGQSRISRHLKILSDAGLVESWKEGVWGFYRIVENGPGRQFIDVIQYLFDDSPIFANDLKRAFMIMEKRKSDTRRFFNTIAASWDRFKQEIIGDFDLAEAMLDHIGHYDAGVDLGCGTGDLLEHMVRHAGRVIGVDSSPAMLDRARERFAGHADHIDFRLGEIEHLPLRDGEVDFAVISLVLQYAVAPETAIAEASRVVRPAGLFVVADFQRHGNKDLFQRFGARWPGFSRQEMEGWLTANGFEVKNVTNHPLEKGLTIMIYQSERMMPV
ncbi:MAG: metalloregulator ArsR/SmtB family transcription factor [Thermodesulfobacteriota bacterium]|nr:metalloregulator ArsR/SmtB family transcription factor [Thermodesulfobacteriota bacterium]